MIIIPSGTSIPSRFSSEQTYDEQSEDDIHICGACKKQFNDIFLFMRHKSDSNCNPRLGRKAAITPPSDSCSTVSSPIFSSLGETGLRPETKYTRVALVDSEDISIQKENVSSVMCEETLRTHPPHLLLADLASQRLDLQNQDVHTEEKTEITMEDDWDLSWSAAKVLGTFSVTNSLRKPQNNNLSPLKETQDRSQENESDLKSQKTELKICKDSTELSTSHGNHVASSISSAVDCHGPERLMGPHGGLLDVQDVEVATLLANHLTSNEPTLQIYPNTTEPFLSYNTLQNHLVIQNATTALNFDGSKRKEPTQNLVKQKTCETSLDSSEGQQAEGQQDKVPSNKLHISKEKSKKPVKTRKLYPCNNEGCNFQGTSSRDLTRHIRKHTGERPFKCTQCDKTFTRGDKLAAHLKCHGEIVKTFECKVCEFKCRESSGLVIHMRRHTDERPYKCQICDHKARTKSHLNVHLRKHTGDHPYKCKKCGRAFTTGSDLTRHSRLHTGDKPFSCPHCTYAAALKTSLKTHIQQNHTPGISLVCPTCHLQCQSRKDLRLHIKTHQDDSKHCTKCNFVASTFTALRKHLRLHTPDKDQPSPLLSGRKGVCKVLQKKKSPLKKHKKAFEVFSDVYQCTYCTASFWREDALDEHVRQHQLDELVTAHVPAPQDPVLADSADSRDSTDSTSMDVTCGLAGLAALASYHSASEQLSSEQPPTFLYRYISGSQGSESNDNLRNAEILASLNQSSGSLPQYVTIQTEQNTLVDALNCIQYVLPSPLGALDDNDNDNATALLC